MREDIGPSESKFWCVGMLEIGVGARGGGRRAGKKQILVRRDVGEEGGVAALHMESG